VRVPVLVPAVFLPRLVSDSWERYACGVVRLLLLTVVALVGVSSAAAAPEGFRETTRLQPIVSALAPGTTVYCSSGEAQWQVVAEQRFPDAKWSKVGAYTDTGGGLPPEMFLNPWACRTLEGWLRGKNTPTLRYMAVYSLTLVHELMHARGVHDERTADCRALTLLPSVLRTHFRVRQPATVRAIMAHAVADNRAKPPAYRC
jgi:hypothetical protein